MNASNPLLWCAGALGAAAVAVAGWYLVAGTPAKEAKKSSNLLPYVTAPGWSFPNQPSIFFLDNDRVIYLGGSEQEYDELIEKRLFAVRIWNWRTGEARSFDRAVFEKLCFDGREVRYIVQRGDIVVQRSGPLDNLRDDARPKEEFYLDALERRGEQDHRFYCRTYKKSELGPEANCRIRLRDGDGILDATGRFCRQAEQNEYARLKALPQPEARTVSADFQYEQQLLSSAASYFTDASSDAILLPIKSREISRFGWKIHYADFVQAYTFRANQSAEHPGAGSTWPEGVAIPFYILRRGGAVERLLIPYDDRLQGAPADAQLSQRGLVLLSTRVRRFPEPGDAGIYLQRKSGTPVKIFSAISEEFRVSPDGCRVAIHSAFFPTTGRKNVRGRMHVLDLCRALPDGN